MIFFVCNCLKIFCVQLFQGQFFTDMGFHLQITNMLIRNNLIFETITPTRDLQIVLIDES